MGTTGSGIGCTANMLTVNGEKMSKSKVGTILPRELFYWVTLLLTKSLRAHGRGAFYVAPHHSSTLDFSNEACQRGRKRSRKLMNALGTLRELSHPGKNNGKRRLCCRP